MSRRLVSITSHSPNVDTVSKVWSIVGWRTREGIVTASWAQRDIVILRQYCQYRPSSNERNQPTGIGQALCNVYGQGKCAEAIPGGDMLAVILPRSSKRDRDSAEVHQPSYHSATIMPPKSPYTFTAPQTNYLKTHLPTYMKAFDGQDSVDAIPRAVETISQAVMKEFKLPDKDKKVVALVGGCKTNTAGRRWLMTRQSVEMWFNYKAQRVEKKRMLSVELRVHGYDIFREEKWESLIRPAVVKALGHTNNRDKVWIGTVQKIAGNLWHGLSEEERSKYEKEARNVNSQNGSRDYKIKYAHSFLSLSVWTDILCKICR